MKKIHLCSLLLLFCAANARADVLLDLEAGDFSQVNRLATDAEGRGEEAQGLYYRALGELYRGRLREARDFLSDVSTASYTFAGWLKSYLNGVLPILSNMETASSEHFIIKTEKSESFLVPYALDSLEKAYVEIGNDLNIYPKEKIQVEIHHTQAEFSISSTLTKEILDRSGAIGICKFRRLMIVSPRELAFGYRWQDALAHEYTHYLVNILSNGKCPLWLHEGIAKYLDTRWRLKVPLYLTPGNRTELAQAAKEDNLIPFSKMAPSMVYLKDQTEVRKAFSQVSHGIDYALKKQKISLGSFVAHFAKENQDQAFYSTMGISFEKFEEDWKDFLKNEKLEEFPGALPDKLTLGKRADEIEEFAGTNIRGHLRLGDRFRQNGRPEMALIQYDKALSSEPGNPVALCKSARALMLLGRIEEAILRLEKCINENPNYPSAFLLLCDRVMEKRDWKRALWLALEANAINPFNPEVHKKLFFIYQQSGENEKSKRENQVAQLLGTPYLIQK